MILWSGSTFATSRKAGADAILFNRCCFVCDCFPAVDGRGSVVDVRTFVNTCFVYDCLSEDAASSMLLREKCLKVYGWG